MGAKLGLLLCMKSMDLICQTYDTDINIAWSHMSTLYVLVTFLIKQNDALFRRNNIKYEK